MPYIKCNPVFTPEAVRNPFLQVYAGFRWPPSRQSNQTIQGFVIVMRPSHWLIVRNHMASGDVEMSTKRRPLTLPQWARGVTGRPARPAQSPPVGQRSIVILFTLPYFPGGCPVSLNHSMTHCPTIFFIRP